MKNLIYISALFITVIFTQFNINFVNALNQNKDLLSFSELQGEKLISSKKFILSVNKTCKGESKLCTIVKIKNNYYLQFSKLDDDEITISKLKNNVELKLKKIKNDNQFFIEIELLSYKNNEKVDSIICYEYKNDPNDSLATEKLYYLKDYELWTLDFTYDLESTTAENWKQYKVNQNSGKFELLKNTQ